MPSSPSLIAKLRHNSPLWSLQRILYRIPGRPLKLRILYFFKFTGDHHSALSPRFPGEIRWGGPEDLPGIIKCAGRGKDKLFRQRLENGDKCIVAINERGITAGYGWLSLDSRHAEDRTGYVFEFPPGSIYAYDFYIHPRFRLTGLWVGFMQLILDSPHYDPDAGLHCFISYGNTASLKPHIRYGFRIYQRKTILSAFGRSFMFEKPLLHSSEVVNRIVHEG